MKKVLLFVLTCIISLTIAAQGNGYTYNVQRAIEAIRSSDYQTATEYLGQELNTNPTNGYAYAFAALLGEDAGIKPYGQMRLARYALQYLPMSERGLRAKMNNIIAEIYLNAQDTATAVTYLNNAIVWQKNEDEHYVNLSDILSEQGRYDDQLALAKQAKKDLPKSSIVPDLIRLNVLVSEKKYADILTLADRLLGVMDKNDDAAYYFSYVARQRAKALSNLHRYDEALTAAMTLADRTSINYAAPVLYLIADSSDYQVVIDSIHAYEQRSSVSPMPALVCSDIYMHKNLYADRLLAMWRAQHIQPSQQVLCMMHEVAMNGFGDSQLALDFLNQSFAMDSTHAQTLWNLADCYSDMGRYEQAIRYATRASEFAPSKVAPYYLRARAHRELKNHREALRDLYSALLCSPRNQDMLFAIAEQYQVMGEQQAFDKALKNAIEISELEGDSLQANHYLIMGDTVAAMAKAEQMCRDGENAHYGTAFYNAACIYARANNATKALATLEQALKAGFANFYHIEWDSDLDLLRTMPEFHETIRVYQEQNERNKQHLHDQLQTINQ